MKVLIQVVQNANCVVDEKLISSISKGYLLLVGFTNGDDERIVTKMADKVANCRIFMDENGKTNKNIYDVNGEILCISQFTLYGDLKKGNRPSFIDSMHGEEAIDLYELFVKKLEEKNLVVKKGIFGADMKIGLVNDGPFTIMLDSKELIK